MVICATPLLTVTVNRPPGTTVPSGQAIGVTGMEKVASWRWTVQVAEPFPLGTGTHGPWALAGTARAVNRPNSIPKVTNATSFRMGSPPSEIPAWPATEQPYPCSERISSIPVAGFELLAAGIRRSDYSPSGAGGGFPGDAVENGLDCLCLPGGGPVLGGREGG